MDATTLIQYKRFAAWAESDISADNGNMVVVITEP